MQIKVTGKNLDVGDALREHIETRLGLLQQKYFDGTVHATVTVEKQRSFFHSDIALHLATGLVLQAMKGKLEAALRDKLIAEGKALKDVIAGLEKEVEEIEAHLLEEARKIPNMAHPEAPVGKEFRLLYDWQNFGMSLPVALQRFADRSPVLDARFFATSVLVQRESGGNLAELLDNLSRVIRERFRVKRQIQVLSAHGRMTGMVLSGMPIALAAYFFITRPEYLSELLTNPMGQKMLIGAAMMQILGTYLISRIVDIEY